MLDANFVPMLVSFPRVKRGFALFAKMFLGRD